VTHGFNCGDSAPPEKVRALESELPPSFLPLIPRESLAAPGARGHGPPMGATKQLPRAEWKDYFERFTREFLSDDGPDVATIEVMSPTLGDQFEVSSARLLGLDYDPKEETFEVLVEDLDHLVFAPSEIWILESEPGFVSTIEVVQTDGTKQLIYLRPSGARADAPPRPAGGPGAPADR
jgi:hypothetical protein